MVEIVIGRNDDDTKQYGKTGTIFIGRHLVGTGEEAHLTTPVMLDVLRPHIIALTGKRGEGKSFSMGILVEELLNLPLENKKNLCSLIIDTQGIFWTMKSANEKEISELNYWSMKPIGFDVKVYIPHGMEDIYEKSGVDYDATFSVKPSEISSSDWLDVFELNPNDMLGILLQKAVGRLKGDYSIDDVIHSIKNQEGFETEKLSLESMLDAAKTWGIFGDSAMPNILEPGKATVLDVSLTPSNVRSLLLAMAARKIFHERTKARRQEELAEIEMAKIVRIPMCWIFLDEAHNFIPDTGRTAATDIILKIVKEGRQPGITLVLATQRPEKLHPDALAQTDMIISHRLTAKNDVDALKAIMQTYMEYDIAKYINELPRQRGSAIILDDNSERVYKIKMRPRQSWHAGESAVAV